MCSLVGRDCSLKNFNTSFKLYGHEIQLDMPLKTTLCLQRYCYGIYHTVALLFMNGVLKC